MKTSISYNLFNGEEHILHSLRTMRDLVDHINIVVQTTSNLGRPCHPLLFERLETIRAERLCEAIIDYVPDLSLAPVVNEFEKRRIGLAAALESGATHFMTMDADEYYVADEFAAAVDQIDRDNISYAAVHSYLHIKRPVWRSAEPDTTCCAFMSRVTSLDNLRFGSDYPVLVDPTRRILPVTGRFHFFDRTSVAMRHMNLVRLDGLDSKLENSSNAAMTDFIAEVRRRYMDWQFGDDLHFPNKPPMRIIEVDDLFSIDQFFQIPSNNGRGRG